MPQGCHEKRQDLVLDNIPLLSFMKRCGENFREILGGRKDPRQVMFPGGNPDAVESIYQDTPQSRYYNGIMARSLKALADALPMDRALSILEIGAGTGGTTSALLPVLPAGRTRYVYTDVSPLFTARARDRFAAFPFVEYATLDISRDPFLQGFHADEFDIVVCANVLHATADLTAALRHISAVLAADGLLLLREITLPRPAMGFEISFGCLLDKLRDGELRGDNPFLTAEGWTHLLDTEGFDRTACYPAPADGDLDEHVIIARNGNGSRQAFSTGIAPARTDAPDGDDTGHILLGRRLSSPLAVSQYTAAVSGTLQPFLAQHRVFDIVVVPGTAHFDLAAAAGMDHFGTDRIRLENVVLREALMLDEGERTVQVLVSPTENGADFEIFSRGAGQGQGEWHQHVSGQLAPAHERSAENVDLDRLREGCDEVDVQAFYEKFDAYGAVQYGPAFRSLRRLWRTRGGAVAEVALDSAERGKKGGFIIHPALLDSCLQSMVAALAATEDDLTGNGFMPFSVEKVIFHGRAPETVWCRAVMKEGDSFRQEMFSASFTIFTPEGEPVCEIVNLTMRRTNKETLELLKAGQRQHTDLCYDVVWRQALMPESGDAAGHWLILAGRDTDFARALARSLEQQGATAMLAACAGTGHPDDMAAVDPGDADAFARLIRDWRQGGTPRGVVFLWGLDCYETDFLGSGGEAPFKNHTAQAFLHLAQALAAQEDGPSVRLAVLTCQAQAARASDQPVPAQSLLWGLEKSVANELGNIAPVIIDMDPVAAPEAQLPTLCGLLTARGYKEDKLALRGSSLLAPRLVRGLPAARQVRNAPLARPETQAYHLDLGGAGIENIRVAPLQRRLPGPGEIEIASEAYGMNFQNVMVAMGVADKIRTLVLDCAGTVSAVGEGVTRFSPGDRVFTTVYGPFASHVYAREAFAASIPEGMPFTDAAVIPTVFMTAWQALVHAARLQPGERVLLHSATGGVGLAAIQIARARGAVILATAGTERKRALLRSMGIEHVFSSRSTAFESRVLKATGGQGVHVVLNFLTGELADSSMRCLTEGGRFIEIGKTDLRTPAQVAAIRDDIEYHIVDLEKLGKEDEAQMRGIFAAVMEGFAAGHYTPIARRVFTMDAARDAFRYMLEGRHIGKVVVRNDFAPRHEGIRREAAYLVTGGLSDLGLALAAHLAARGAGQVWLLGRRLPEAGSAGAAAVEKIAATGCDVRLLQVDVTDRTALAEAFGTHLLPSPRPLAGVFHLAGLLDDAPLSRLDWARFNTVLSPKVDGSWFLHELTRDLALDHFVVFSSIASVFGTHGQANHVAANTFMDALVAARRADFLPGLSINWGAWGELGTVVRLGILDRIRQQGVEGFDTATGLAVLDRLMASGEGSNVVTRMDWNRMLPILQATAGAAMYEELRHSPAAARPAETAGNSRLAAELRALPMSGREERLRAYLKKEIAGFLRLEEDAIPEDVNLTSLGMDSLISLDLFQRISRDLKIRIAPHEVSATPTVQAMAARFARDLGPASGEEETAPAVQSGTPATKEEGAGLSALLVPAPDEAFEPFPLSDMQQAYWIGRDQSGLALGGVSCHFYFEAQARGLDADRYEEAWNRLILRQPMLRTIILDGERQQVLEKVPHYTIRRHDLRQSSPEEAAAHFERIRMEMSHEVLDVGRWPNFRVEVSLLPDDALRIHLSFDLILSDFHGISQMLAELSLIYNGQEDKLPVLDITFRDYRLAEERYRATGIYARDRDYWLARLDDLPAAPRLPLATSPAAIDRPVFSRRMTTLDKETWQRIKQRGDARGLAPTAVALATFAEVLGCWSEEKRFCINLTLFNRLPLHRQVNALVGEFTSNSLLAVDLTQGGSFETRAGRLWSRLWDDMEHRSFSGIRVLRELGRRRGTAAGIMPVIFTSALSMESSSGTFALGQMGHEVYSISQTPQVWLDHQLFEVDGELRIVFDYVRDLFPDGMIDAMFEAYAEALRRLSRDDAAWGDAVPGIRVMAMGGATEASIWSNFHETGPDDARWASVPYGRPLANQAFAVLDDRLQPRPDWVAGDLYISGDGLALGYWNDPEKTAGAFLPAGDGHPRLYRTGDTARYHDDGTLEFLGRKDEQVKIHGYRVEPGEIESVLKAHPAVNNAAVLLHKGAEGELSLTAYVEADPGHRGEIVREERAASRLEDGLPLRADGREGLDEERFLPVWDKMKELYAAAVTAALEELGFFGHGYRDTETFLHDSGISPRYGRWLARAVKALHDLGLADRDGDGVWQRRGTAPDREACLAFCADRAGELGYSPQEMALLARTVRELPAILREDVHSAEFYTSAEVPGFYQKIFGASNRLTADLVTGLAAASGNGFRILEVGGGYGTVTRFVLPGLPDGGVTYDFTDISPFFLNKAREEFAGYPFVNYRLLDLDEDPRLMGFEPHGYDLILAGNVLHDAADIRRSLKYLTGLLKPSGILLMQEETVFQLPFDLSMGLQQGFDSARDEEFRPEQPLLTRELWTKALTEAGLSRPSFLMPPASLESRLGLEVILSEGPSSVARFTPRPLEDHLRGHLPAWMIPVSWTLLDRMPLTRNGKVDRKRLSGGAVRQRPRTGVTARTRTEQAVAAIWKNVLRVDDVGVTDSFFLSGGDSLSAFQLLRQLEREFGCRLTLRDLLQAPTVAAQAALVDHKPGASAGELVCLHDADGPATVCMMHPVEGLVNAYAPLAAKLGEVSFHALQSAGLDGGPLRTAFPDMVTAALEAVEGLPRPLLLGGWSMGAFLAWETARRLLAGGQGEHLLPLVLLDPPSKPAWDSLYDSRAHDPAALLGLVAPAPQKALAALGMSEGDLAALDAPARARVLAEALRSSGQLAVEKDDLEMAGRVMEIIDANLRALRSYAPQPLEGLPVLYVRSNSMEEDDDRTAYWRGLAGSGFEELAVDADHWNLLHDPGSVDAIAARLARLLKKHA
ncbi:KR domain-containing protein [Desulfovibrio piger]|uniref:L-cysteine--[L-cysteinyl-carrier protein] ligase n=1 Tax=Desulfovibrio piger TaxID=901 RepID=A0A848CG23_9BACT|nr:KR domain-containing protein [Desulfovibrio piger]NME51143.1 KR domain-containing protein [Desulfovibrio piger]